MKRLRNARDWGKRGWDEFFDDTGTHWRDKDYRFLADVFDLSGLQGSLLDAGCALGDGQALLYSLCHNVTEYMAAISRTRRSEPASVTLLWRARRSSSTTWYFRFLCLSTTSSASRPSSMCPNLRWHSRISCQPLGKCSLLGPPTATDAPMRTICGVSTGRTSRGPGTAMQSGRTDGTSTGCGTRPVEAIRSEVLSGVGQAL